LENVIHYALLTTAENQMITGELLRTTINEKPACKQNTTASEGALEQIDQKSLGVQNSKHPPNI
jgi:hypothetical protein